jgi:glucosamine--fructose-6-phosphate aminotransferase (isomerizing)
MCGIVGYIGKQNAIPILINGLYRLEYRGYDSCGISIIANNSIKTIKTNGKISVLENKLKNINLYSNIGIAHTRWATHGAPNEKNAHPHSDCKNSIVIAHNGIIENYDSLKKLLSKEGHKFTSDTDSEVIAHLIEKFYKGDLLEAVTSALSEVVGSYGLLVMHKDKQELIGARKGSPLVFGINKIKKEYFIASDVSAIIEHTNKVIYLEDNEIVDVTNKGYKIINLKETHKKVNKEIEEIKYTLDQIEKGGYKHFMLKEIFEQQDTVVQALAGRIDFKKLDAKLGGLETTLSDDNIKKLKRIIIIGCGSSWHAGLVSKYVLEKYTKIPVDVEYASEFRYGYPIIDKDTLVIAISQSGETIDTLAALRKVKELNGKTFGIVNVVGSTISRETDCGIYTRAGPEIGVASTKAFTNQLVCMYLLTLYIAKRKKTMGDNEIKEFISDLMKLPEYIKQTLKKFNQIKIIAKKMSKTKNCIFLGRGINYPIALEGALKLKEISYIHAEGYPAAEMKHGPIALIDKHMPVIVIVNKDKNYEKVISNINEIKARGGKIVAIATQGDIKIKKISDQVLYVPKVPPLLNPFINVVVLQLLAYYVADEKKCEIDKPRNLAKSVTVE